MTISRRKNLFIFMLLTIAAMLALGACGGSGGDSGGGNRGPDLFMIANFAAADVVIGQPDFTSDLKNQGLSSADADTLCWPYGNPLLHNGTLYIPDYGNNRVLGFDQVPVVNGASADFVIGKHNFTSTGTSTAADGAHGPQTMKVHDGKLLMTMFSSNSVYIYNTVPMTNGASADIIVGQDDFSIGANGCAANRLYHPESLFVVDGKLIVTDSWNDRVLIWNTIPITNGASADIVLGQTALDNCTLDTTPPTASTLNWPADAWSDGTRLIVTDRKNNRVLIWNTLPTQNGQPADLVLGQPDMTSNTPGVSDRDLDYPYFLASNGIQLFVSDESNSRVLIWDTIPTQSYTPADGVLGQPDFDCNNINENDGDCLTPGDEPGPRGMFWPNGLLLTGDMLIVMDDNNNRAMVFRE